jgi:DNA topoisomerase-1
MDYKMEFNEITKSAIENALTHPTKINMNMVHSQQARRILDRIIGYYVTPQLWKVFSMRNISAGRVLSIVTKIIIEKAIEPISTDRRPSPQNEPFLVKK